MRNEATQRTHTHNVKSKGKYRFVREREADGAQLFQAAPDNRTADKTIWLTGQDRCQGLRPGMEGEIHYFHGINFGRHVFVKKEEGCII